MPTELKQKIIDFVEGLFSRKNASDETLAAPAPQAVAAPAGPTVEGDRKNNLDADWKKDQSRIQQAEERDIDVDGHLVKVNELKACWRAAHTNALPETKKEDEAGAIEKEEKKERKENSAPPVPAVVGPLVETGTQSHGNPTLGADGKTFFLELKNARENGSQPLPEAPTGYAGTRSERIQRGREKYGSLSAAGSGKN